MEPSDEDLVIKYLKGDNKALNLLIERYLRPIYGLAFRYVGNSQQAEDISQDTFLKAWKNLRKFDPKKSFKAWIFRICRNTIIDSLRKKKTVPFSFFDQENGANIIEDSLRDEGPSPLEIFDLNLAQEKVKKALTKLPEKYQKVVFLRYQEQLEFQEIADFLNKPLNTVKSWHRRALIQLKSLLAPKP